MDEPTLAEVASDYNRLADWVATLPESFFPPDDESQVQTMAHTVSPQKKNGSPSVSLPLKRARTSAADPVPHTTPASIPSNGRVAGKKTRLSSNY